MPAHQGAHGFIRWWARLSKSERKRKQQLTGASLLLNRAKFGRDVRQPLDAVDSTASSEGGSIVSLRTRIPDAQVLISLAPEELAPQLLSVLPMRPNVNQGMFNRDYISRFAGEYPHLQADVELAITEAWRWLELNLFIVPAPGINGQNGWFVPGRRGRAALANPQLFTAYTKAAAFPRELLHPLIAERVWAALARGDYADAVFLAFRTVEESVRQAGSYSATDIGTDLMRSAFEPENGPLTKLSDPRPERLALSHLFAGAIGSYKNPHSHRTVTISDAGEAQEMVMLASHLLRIVDARKPSGG